MSVSTLDSLLPYVLIILAVLLTAVIGQLGRRLRLRTPPGYAALPLAVEEAVEAGCAVHVSLGSGAIQDSTALSAVAGIAVARYAATKALNSDHPPLVTTSEATTLPLAQDSVRQAYQVRGRQSAYRPEYAQWTPQGRGAVTFAAGTAIALTAEAVEANVLVGQFGAEMVIVTETAQRERQTMIAHSDRMEGQAIAYAVSSTPLIGEELYVADSYLSGRPSDIGAALTMDVLRYAIIALIVIGALVGLFGGTR